MKLYFTFTKRNLAVILATVVIAFILLGQFLTVNSGGVDGSTNAKRIEYLSRLGLDLNETPTDVKEITIPQNFSKVYEKYNSLQKESGFNLKNYKGKKANVYTYSFWDNKENAVHLIVCEDRIIGGDIASLKIDGEMTGLK